MKITVKDSLIDVPRGRRGEWLSVGEDVPMLGTPWRRAHRGFERCGSVVRPQEGYSPEILSHLSFEYVPSKGIQYVTAE